MHTLPIILPVLPDAAPKQYCDMKIYHLSVRGDESRGLRGVTYDNDGYPSLLNVDYGGYTICHTRDGLGNRLSTEVREGGIGAPTVEENRYTGDGHVIRDGVLVMSRFPGGYFDADLKPHYYITDYQGNIVGVHDGKGNLEQQVDYYPYGEPWLEPEYTDSRNANRYLFGGKERIFNGRINEYDFHARTYLGSQCRFSTIDPLAGKTPWLSPYTFCASNPVNFTDPDGRHTRVKLLGEGRYGIEGGEIDDDLNIYVYTQDANGEYTIRGESIGISLTPYSFYNSDSHKWIGTIDTNDQSGTEFINAFLSNKPTLRYYIQNATNGGIYDFKALNSSNKNNKILHYYRGMPIDVKSIKSFYNTDKKIYGSARDVGNLLAGYISAYRGLKYHEARLGFDLYQTYKNHQQSTEGESLKVISVEGISTQYAEFVGYGIGKACTPYLIRYRNRLNNLLDALFK